MCKYCDIEDAAENILSKKVSVLNEKIRFEVFLNGDTIALCAGEEYVHPIAKRKIKYCPMCGRKLNGESV